MQTRNVLRRLSIQLRFFSALAVTLGLLLQLSATSAFAGIAGPQKIRPDLAKYWHQGSPGVKGALEEDFFGDSLAVGDFNGDGFPDLAVGSPFENVGGQDLAGAVSIFYGNAQGFNVSSPDDQLLSQDTPGIPLANEENDRWGDALAAADFNGDGFDDLAVGAPKEGVGSEDSAGGVTIIWGSQNGLDLVDVRSYHQDSVDFEGDPIPGTAKAGDRFGAALAAGDFDRDGFADLAISVHLDDPENLFGHINQGAVQILYGHGERSLDVRAATITKGYLTEELIPQAISADNDRFGQEIVAGDFNNDGYADLAVGSPNDDEAGAAGAGILHVFYGSDQGLRANAGIAEFSTISGLGGTASAQLGWALAVGDHDGDGFRDLAVSVDISFGDGSVVFLYGSSGGLKPPAPGSGRRAQLHENYGSFGRALSFGDFNGDGFDDLVVASDEIDGPADSGAVQIFFGERVASNPFRDFPIQEGVNDMPGTAESAEYFGRVLTTGDFTGDGNDDLIVGIPRELVGSVNAGAIAIVPGEKTVYCVPGADELCLRDRFRVTLDWETTTSFGEGHAVDQGSEDSGMFWFFEPNNWEMLIKVLDACAVNDRFWVFAAPTTDVGYRLTVVDEATSETQVYTNQLGSPAQALADVDAFSSACGVQGYAPKAVNGVPSVASTEPRPSELGAGSDSELGAGLVTSASEVGTCVSNPTTLCLGGQRFRVRVDWITGLPSAGSGQVAPVGTPDSGVFYFFQPNNWEMLIKVLDGCVINNRFWVFSGAATDVGYELTVTDTVTGRTVNYSNSIGVLAPAITDVGALPCTV